MVESFFNQLDTFGHKVDVLLLSKLTGLPKQVIEEAFMRGEQQREETVKSLESYIAGKGRGDNGQTKYSR